MKFDAYIRNIFESIKKPMLALDGKPEVYTMRINCRADSISLEPLQRANNEYIEQSKDMQGYFTQYNNVDHLIFAFMRKMMQRNLSATDGNKIVNELKTMLKPYNNIKGVWRIDHLPVIIEFEVDAAYLRKLQIQKDAEELGYTNDDLL
jgi:NADPH-dependent 7-cyano-7-deazaguanine reductase QueF-like protein